MGGKLVFVSEEEFARRLGGHGEGKKFVHLP